VEDAPAGIEAGKKADMRVIGVAFTCAREELLAKGADVVIGQLSSINVQDADGGRVLLAVHTQ
jgi:beta-phosphoglucomutase-like phosphatase (HAD superfamily)